MTKDAMWQYDRRLLAVGDAAASMGLRGLQDAVSSAREFVASSAATAATANALVVQLETALAAYRATSGTAPTSAQASTSKPATSKPSRPSGLTVTAPAALPSAGIVGGAVGKAAAAKAWWASLSTPGKAAALGVVGVGVWLLLGGKRKRKGS